MYGLNNLIRLSVYFQIPIIVHCGRLVEIFKENSQFCDDIMENYFQELNWVPTIENLEHFKFNSK